MWRGSVWFATFRMSWHQQKMVWYSVFCNYSWCLLDPLGTKLPGRRNNHRHWYFPSWVLLRFFCCDCSVGYGLLMDNFMTFGKLHLTSVLGVWKGLVWEMNGKESEAIWCRLELGIRALAESEMVRVPISPPVTSPLVEAPVTFRLLTSMMKYASHMLHHVTSLN